VAVTNQSFPKKRPKAYNQGMIDSYKDYSIKLVHDKTDGSKPELMHIRAYSVSKPDFECRMIFGDGLLERMANQHERSESDMEKLREDQIKEKIDEGELLHGEEYTYQLYPGNYLLEDNVSWWQKAPKSELL
jgi:hypothetical protein